MEEQAKQTKKRKESKQITGEQYRKLFLFLSFFVPFEMMLVIFACKYCFPFGDQCFLISDLYHQYFPFFQEFSNKIRSGEGILYSWNMGLGTDFYAIYSYYLASPLNWLVFLFPAKYLLEVISGLVILKVGLTGLTSYLFFIAKDKKDGTVHTAYFALLFSICYAMSGYVAAYNINIMWMDCIVLAPVILLGLERLVKEGKSGIYTVSLAVCIYTNFYLSVMVCIFLVIYFFYLILTEQTHKNAFLRFAIASLLAGGMAAVILVPAAIFMMNSNVEQAASFPTNLKAFASFFKVLARHCAMIKTSTDHGILPNVYCGTAAFLFVPLYCMNKEISIKKRVVSILIVVFFLLSFMTNVLEYIWHGLKYPYGFPARQSFLYILFLLAIGFECLKNINGIKTRHMLISCVISATFLLLTKFFFQSEDFHEWDWLITLAFVAAYAICLFCCYGKKNEKKKELVAILCYVLMVGECSLNMLTTSVKTTFRDPYFEDIDTYGEFVSEYSKDEEEFQRFGSYDKMTENDSVLYGYPSASVFSSMWNTDVGELYTKMGMAHGKAYYEVEGATPFVMSILNIGYLFSWTEDDVNEYFDQIEEKKGIYLYKATQSLPFGYVAPKGFDMPEREGALNSLELQNELASQLSDMGALFQRIKVSRQGKCVLVQTETDGHYYAVLHNEDINTIVEEVQDIEVKRFAQLKVNRVLDLGVIARGQRIVLSYPDMMETEKQLEVSVYQLNENALIDALDNLRQKHMEQVEIHDTTVLGHLELKEEGRLVLSIPYDKGWSVSVNGEKSGTSCFGGALMAFDLEPGSYEIEMHYFPLGLKLGIGISLFSLLIFGLLIFCGKRKAIVHFS